jgi:hypothetical protein
VEYGQSFAIFGEYNVSPLVYSLAFGGILPLVSLLFARILADTTDDRTETNNELMQSKLIIRQLRGELKIAEDEVARAEAKAIEFEQRFAAAGDLMARLFAEEKRQRIEAAAEHWPQLPAASIAIISGASPSYVSEVLKSPNER